MGNSIIRNRQARWILLLFICRTIIAGGQITMPGEFARAINSGTRTSDGVPGPKYVQNSAEYRIDVKFDPVTGNLSGTAEIKYYNNSPDTLRQIFLHLYQNLLKKGCARDMEFDPSVIHDGVEITALQVNDEELTNKLLKRTRTEGTLFAIFLIKPLIPMNYCTIKIAWNNPMPQMPVKRYGKYDQGTYFIAYWYPQICVYDDLNGWDLIPYTGTQEFYNDFNNYDISIHLPPGYMAWATGNWTNAELVLNSSVYERYQKAKIADQTVSIITAADLKSKKVFSGRGAKTYHFTAELVPDFAFGVSDRYCWDGASVVIDSSTMKRVFVSAAYKPGADNFNLVTGYGTDAIRQMAYNSYRIPYPYPGVTVFNGEGGMEYPMIVNNGASFTKEGTLFVTMHEIAHAYFPFLTGINEKKYSIIDEGLTTYLPILTEKALGFDTRYLEENIQYYERVSGSELDIPLNIPAWQIEERVYLYLSYYKSVVAFSMLEKYLGEELFRRLIQQFIQLWEYKHSTPYDLFNFISKNTGGVADWFINAWFFGQGYPELELGEISQTGNSLKIEVKKTGMLPTPISLCIKYKSAEPDTIDIDPGVWIDNNTFTTSCSVYDEVEGIVLGTPAIPDKDRSNNYVEFSEGKN